jgi:DNA-binding NarL/FixJ family response regulator
MTNSQEKVPARGSAKPATEPRKTAAKPKAKAAEPAASKPTRGFIDVTLMERAIALRKEGKTMKEIGAELGVKSTAYLAVKIKQLYGADALDKAAKAEAGS